MCLRRFEFCSWSLYVPMICFIVSRMSQKTWKESFSISWLPSPFYYLRAWPCTPLGVSSLGAFWGSMRACKGNCSINTRSRSSRTFKVIWSFAIDGIADIRWRGNVTLCDRFALRRHKFLVPAATKQNKIQLVFDNTYPENYWRVPR